jgi:hypothetical protein
VLRIPVEVFGSCASTLTSKWLGCPQELLTMN